MQGGPRFTGPPGGARRAPMVDGKSAIPPTPRPAMCRCAGASPARERQGGRRVDHASPVHPAGHGERQWWMERAPSPLRPERRCAGVQERALLANGREDVGWTALHRSTRRGHGERQWWMERAPSPLRPDRRCAGVWARVPRQRRPYQAPTCPAVILKMPWALLLSKARSRRPVLSSTWRWMNSTKDPGTSRCTGRPLASSSSRRTCTAR